MPIESVESSPSLPRPFLEYLGRQQDVANLIPDSERRCPQETVPLTTNASKPSGKDSRSENRDVSNLRPDYKRRPLETVPLTTNAPPSSGKDSRSENGDVSNLRSDSKRRYLQEALPSPPDALLPTSGETNPHPAETHRQGSHPASRKPVHGDHHSVPGLFPFNTLKGGGPPSYQDADEDILDIPTRCSPIEATT